MKRHWKLIFFGYLLLDVLLGYSGLLPLTELVAAQFTQVTGTVLDPTGVPYSYGTITALLSSPGGTATLNGLAYTPPTQPAGLDVTGKFTIQIADNTQLLPAGSGWNFQVCSAIGTVLAAIGNGSICFSLPIPITISGSTQDISQQLTAAAAALTIQMDGNYRLNNSSLLTPQQLYAKTNFSGGEVDWSFVTPGANQVAAFDLFQNTATLLAPLVSMTSSCAGIANFIPNGQFLTVFLTEFDPYGEMVHSLPTTVGPAPNASTCYTVNLPPTGLIYSGLNADLTPQAYYAASALACVSPCTTSAAPAPPVAGTLQFSTDGGGNWVWVGKNTTTKTFNYTTAVTAPLTIAGGCVFSAPGGPVTTTCPMGVQLANANPGLEVANTTINLNTHGGFLTIQPTAIPTGSKLKGLNRQSTTVMQLSASAPNGIPAMVVANAHLISGGAGAANNVVTLQLGMLEAASGSEQVVYLSAPVTSGVFDSLKCPTNGFCTVQANNPAPPLVFQPWIGSTLYQVGARITDQNTPASTGRTPSIWIVTAAGTTSSAVSFTPTCTTPGVTTATEGSATFTCLLNPGQWAAGKTPAQYAVGTELYDAAHGIFQMVTAVGGGNTANSPTYQTLLGGITTTADGYSYMALGASGQLNVIVSPQFIWYAAACANPTSGQCALSALRATTAAGSVNFSGCSGQNATGQFASLCNGSNNLKANVTTFTATGANAAPPAVTPTAIACPTGYASCPNVLNVAYFISAVPTTDGGITNLQGEASVTPAAGQAIQVPKPANLPANSTGWNPAIGTTSNLESIQTCDGVHCFCGNGGASQYTTYKHATACSTAATTATIVNPVINAAGPYLPLWNATNVIFYNGGVPPLVNPQNEVSLLWSTGGVTPAGYGAGLEDFKVECGRSLNNLEPIGMAIYEANIQEHGGGSGLLFSDCPMGLLANGPGAQNSAFKDLQFQGQNADYSFGAYIQDVPSFRYLEDCSCSAFQINTQWYSMFGVGVGQTNGAGGGSHADIQDIAAEVAFDLLYVRNASANFLKLTPSASPGRRVTNTVHADFNSNNVAGFAALALSPTCALQIDVKDPGKCRWIQTLSAPFYVLGDLAANASSQAIESMPQGPGTVGKPYFQLGLAQNVGAQTIYGTVNSAGSQRGSDGMYRVNVSMWVATLGAACTLPTLTLAWNDVTAQSITLANQLSGVAQVCTAQGSPFSWSGVIHAARNTNITLQTSGGVFAGGFTYSYETTIEALNGN